MKMPPPAWRHALALIAIVLLLQAGGDGVRTALRFSRPALEHGEWWRLLTAHFVHLGWAHTILNVLGILLCRALAPGLFDRGIWPKTAALALGVGALLWWSPGVSSPGVSSYVGLSGVLYGMFALGLLPQAWRKDRLAALALLCTATWMAWQWAAGPSAQEESLIGGRIIAIAHVYGFTLGIVGALAGLLWARTKN